MAPPTDYTLRESDGVTVVRFDIESLMGALEVSHLSDELDALVENGAHRIVLDFKHVRYAGSAALGMMMSLLKKLNALNGKLVLSHTEHIESLLRVIRAGSVFTIAPDVHTAIELCKSPE